MTKKLTTDEFIEKARIIHSSKYDYSKFNYYDSQTKSCIICSIHGEFYQTPNNHLNGSGCSKCGDIKTGNSFKLTTEEFIKKAKAIHGDKYLYSDVNYKTFFDKVLIKCKAHGGFEQIPANHLKGQGCPYCSNNKKYTTEEFIEKANKVHNNKFNYLKTNYINSNIKITIICPVHGEFYQTPGSHLNGNGCPKCSNNKKLTTEEFITKAKVEHGVKYDYSKTNYVNSHTKVTIICPEHGEFNQIPNGHLNGKGCPICKSSKGEMIIKSILDKHNIVSVREWKHPDEKYRYEYDFYLPELNILIEFHGIQHYEHRIFFHKTYEIFKQRQEDDIFKKSLAWDKRIPMLEFNYKQLKHMSEEQFENLVIVTIQKYIR